MRALLIALALIAISLLAPERRAPAASWNCPECRDWCGVGPQGDWCMTTCRCDNESAGASAPDVFGAIAYSPGDQRWATITNVASRQYATNEVLKMCREGSKTPNQCEVAAWFGNGCGALAVGDKGRWSGIGGQSLKKQSEALALKDCSDKTSGCEVWISACANDVSPAQAAADAKAKAAIANGMMNALCKLWGTCPAVPASPKPK